jgi:excisionase family DNA binding protein
MIDNNINFKEGDFIKPTEVAKILCVTPAHIYNLIRSGELKSISSGKAKRVFLSSLNEYIKAIEFNPNV